MHWDHEPTPNPSKEGSRTTRSVLLLGGVLGGFIAGTDRFMDRGNGAAYHPVHQTVPGTVKLGVSGGAGGCA